MRSVEVVISDVAAGGDGLGRDADGRIVFARGAIPGDRALVAVDTERPTMLRGAASAILEPSPDRITAPCPHVADGCGGCGWQHVAPEAQRELKVRIAEESLRRVGGVPGEVGLAPALPVAGFRTTVRCLVVDGRAAFRAARDERAVPVASCMVAHPGIDDLIAHGRFGTAREVTLRVGAATGERIVVADPTVGEGMELPADVRVVGSDELDAGRRVWFHDVVEGRRFRISATSFFQTRTDGAEALVAAVRRAADGTLGDGRLVDLYGGVGLFGACLGKGMRVTLVEANRPAVADARHNLRDRCADVVRSSAQRWRPAPADVVVADPPRAGLGADVVARVAATGARRVVLVSCDAAAFGRDAGLLDRHGYRRVSTELVDLFPHTPHLELVSRFDRADDGSGPDVIQEP